ncbi:hypothetical protein [Mucilaginibacter flavus]|uniref:hypothetical protein n=1 Tax=Mucilaginibacter flavus TaxID=931504 RepID=UPI0025B36EFC|nr:hypothetical protein [Mucilaginibacter flavus]MDN3581486.1 hypothetical protein [Mucilaginibacter flavus]
MNETITVDEALKRGQRMVNYPVIAIQVIGYGSAYCLTKFPAIPQWLILILFLFVFIGAWLYWSFKITTWRLWAFEHVDNVYELKLRAIQGKLIWPDGSFFEKTEIRFAADKKKWAQIQERFDDIEDDESENIS